jgi:hypothetical protein
MKYAIRIPPINLYSLASSKFAARQIGGANDTGIIYELRGNQFEFRMEASGGK